MIIRPRDELAGLGSTVHGGQGWKLSGVEDYSQNLNPKGIPPGMEASVMGSIQGLDHYPDADCSDIRAKVAAHHGVSPENVAMGAGSSEIIRNFPFAFLNKGDRVLVPRPSFAEYSQQIILAGGVIDYMDLLPENGFHIDADEMCRRISAGGYRAVYVCNPNNPTGRVETRETLERIASECEKHDTLMFLDETLLELVYEEPDISLIPVIRSHPNLLVARSFTKSFAVPGVRVGYGIADPAIIAEIQKVRLPWNLGAMEQAAVGFMVDNFAFVEEAAAELRAESSVFYDEMKAILPLKDNTESFFFFTDLSPLGISVADLSAEMVKRGFVIRDCASFGYPTYVRFCVKDRGRDSRFAEAMAESVAVLKG